MNKHKQSDNIQSFVTIIYHNLIIMQFQSHIAIQIMEANIEKKYLTIQIQLLLLFILTDVVINIIYYYMYSSIVLLVVV